MFCNNNDSWFINESLAFYLSTNTFSNPLFETTPQEIDFESASAAKVSGTVGVDETVTVNNGNNMKQEAKCPNGQHQKQLQSAWSEFCGNLLFSIRSKIDVLELDFKLKLRRLRKFASEHKPSFMSSHNGFRRNYNKKPATGTIKMDDDTLWTASRTLMMDPRQVGLDKGTLTATDRSSSMSVYKGKYWGKIGLSSRDSFDVQQEKILNRLEQAVQAKRNCNNHREQLFNMNRCDGLSGGPIQSATKSTTTSDATSLSSIHSSHSLREVSERTTTTTSGIKSGYKIQNGHTMRQARKNNIWISAATAAAKRRTKDTAVHDLSNASKRLCIICYTNPPNIVTLPCKHHEICSDCFIEIIYLTVKQSQYPLKCVLCRQKIERIGCSRKLLLKVIEKNRTQP